MNPTPSAPRSSFRLSRPIGLRGLVLAGLLGWAAGTGCAVEEPVAYILTPDGGFGPLDSPDGEEVLPAGACDVPDAGAPCPGVPEPGGQ